MFKKPFSRFLAVLVMVIFAFLYINFFSGTGSTPETEPLDGREETGSIENASPTHTQDEGRDEINRPQSVVLAAVGDIMIHSPQFNGAYVQAEDRYDFNDNFTYIAPYLQEADYAVVNLETTLAGQEYGYSGYPMFNSPPEIASALKNCGFDLLSTANNHSLDRGEEGILNTIAHIEAAGLDFVGTARSEEEGDEDFVLLLNDLKIVFFAYTYGTNGLPVPAGKDYLVNLLSREKMDADIRRAKNELKADIIVLCLHWGDEYHRLPAEQQRSLAEDLIDKGADLIIGNHSHVVQPAEYIRTDNNAGLVLYSLGNFISNQRDRYCDSGAIAFIEIIDDPRTDTNSVSLQKIIPTWVYRYYEQNRAKYKILPVLGPSCIERYQEMFNLSTNDRQRLEEVPLEIREIMGYYSSAP
ncbi:MAG: CapA family protein [Firmicutes bacterium]|mgnify:CR=1 FL=1|nr:CapA family protein [Bacillota bacterium]